MVDNNDSLFREVEEELRREQMAKLWDKYGLYVVGLASLLLAAVGGYQLYKGRQLTLANEGGSLYEKAEKLAEEKKPEEAARAFEALAEGGHRGYATLARLQLAGTDLKAGKRDEALARFEAISKDSTADPLLKSFATLQAAALRLGQADLSEMKNRLNDLAVDASPWRAYARELLGIAAYKAGDPTAAMQYFEQILSDNGGKDPLQGQLTGIVAASLGPPQGVLQRVRVLMGMITAELMAKAAPGASPATAADAKAPEAPAAAAAPKADSDQAAPATEPTAPAEK